MLLFFFFFTPRHNTWHSSSAHHPSRPWVSQDAHVTTGDDDDGGRKDTAGFMEEDDETFLLFKFFLHCAISIREIDLMMGRETTGKGHPWMGGHCKYDGWMTGERHVFFADATATFCFLFLILFLIFSLSCSRRGTMDGPCCTRDSRMETVRYIELPTYRLYVVKYADNSHLLFYVYE